MKKIVFLFLLLSLIIFIYSIDIDLEYQGIPSSTNQFVIKNDTLLFGLTGNAIEVYNIKNGNLDLLNRQYFLKEFMYNLEVYNNYLIVSYSTKREIDIFDISNPLNIAYIDSLKGFKYFNINDTILYTFFFNSSFDSSTLYIYNLSDLPIIDTISITPFPSLRVQGRFMVYQDTLLYPYVNISDLYNPIQTLLDTEINPHIIEDTIFYGNNAFMSASYNIKDVNNAIFLDTIVDFPYGVPKFCIDKVDTLLFINYKNESFVSAKIINVSNYSDFTDIYEFEKLYIQPFNILEYGIIVKDTFLFKNDFYKGLSEYNISNPINPVLKNKTKNRFYEIYRSYYGNIYRNSFIFNDTIFIANGNNIFKKSINDTITDSYECFTNDSIILCFENIDSLLLFTSNYDSNTDTLKLILMNTNFDILDTVYKRYSTFSENNLIIINDSLFYYLEHTTGESQLYKIANSQINYIADVNLDTIYDYILIDNKLYVIESASSQFFSEYDITDPLNPIKIDSVSIVLGSYINLFRVLKQQKHYIYYFSADFYGYGNNVIYCFDISDKDSINIANTLNINRSGEFLNMEFCNNYIIVYPNADFNYTALIYDVNDPLNPILIDSTYYFNGLTSYSISRKNYIYVSDLYAGINKVRIGSEGPELICNDSLLFATDSIKGICLYNTGGANIIIDSILGIDAPFELITLLPETIGINDSLLLELKCNDLSIENSDSMYIYSNDVYKIYNKVYLRNDISSLIKEENIQYDNRIIQKVLIENGILKFSLRSNSEVLIKVYNTIGQSIYRNKKYYNKGEYNVELYKKMNTKGLYFIEIRINNEIYKFKYINL